jgi:uncharacterized membrane protein YdbT with pleckstrin-like domain
MQLLEGEELIWTGRPSWRSMLTFYVRWGTLALVPVVVVAVVVGVSDVDWPIWVGVVITLILLAIVLVTGWIKRIETRYTVTDRRLIIRHGILTRKEQSAHIDRVQNVNTAQTVLERMLRVGTVDFDTAGTDDYEFKFAGVEDPRGLREIIAKAYGDRLHELERDPSRR